MPVCRMIPGINDIDGSDPVRRKFVITGCGRSGTLYMRKLFLIFGYDLGHEGFRKDGITSWYIAESARAEFIRSYFARKFHNTSYIHLLRDPVKVIGSMYKLLFLPNRAGLDFFKRSHPEYNHLDGTLEHVMVWWKKWNQLCRVNYPNACRARVEDMATEKGFEWLCKITGTERSNKLYNKVCQLSHQTHTLKPVAKHYIKAFAPKASNIGLMDMYNANPELAKTIQKMAAEYGYDIRFPSC